MVIKDVDGKKLSLSKTYLTEVDFSADTMEYGEAALWRAKLYYLCNNKLVELEQVNSTPFDSKGSPGETLVENDFAKYTIGCHKFDKKTFALITKAIKEAKAARKKQKEQKL